MHRLVTRSDFDGLVCAVLLRHLDLIDDIAFVHPKDVQDGVVEITGRDILTNLPYAPDAALVFDHHHSEGIRVGGAAANHVIDADAPSAARVVYDHFGGAERFPQVSDELLAAVDQADSAAYAPNDILRPAGLDAPQLHHGQPHRPGPLPRLPDLQLRADDGPDRGLHPARDGGGDPGAAGRRRAGGAVPRAARPVRRPAAARVTLHGDVVVVDLRGEDVIHAGNRFMVYALYPEARVSVHVIPGKEGRNTVLAVGRSIIDRSSTADIGAAMLRHGGGGHRAAGTCQVPHERAEAVLAEVIGAVGSSPVAV